MPAGPRRPCWTLFIVGRRNHQQNTYVITQRSRAACGLPPEMTPAPEVQ